MKEYIKYNKIEKTIEKVVAERETDSSVWINGKQIRRDTICHKIYDTKEEAIKDAIEYEEFKIDRLRKQIEQREKNIEKIKSL